MIALILAAGYGTRLYPLAESTPKALLPVKGKPILGYLVEKLEPLSSDLKEIVLVSNHRYAENFQEWTTRSGQRKRWVVLDDRSTSEKDRLGSMGDLAFAIRSHRLEDDLLVLGSDNLFQGGLKLFVDFAKRKTPGVTLGAYQLPDASDASRYGVLTLDGEGRVLQFEEKPPHPTSSLISMALYFFPRTALNLVLEYVGSSKSTDTLGSFIHWLLGRVPVFAYPFRGLWFDIGDVASYNHAQETFDGS